MIHICFFITLNLDLLKVIEGFGGRKISGNGSHFTYRIPEVGTVYLVYAHGADTNNRKVSGTYIKIFRDRLKQLKLIDGWCF